LTRRLSFFRSEQEKHEAGLRNNSTSAPRRDSESVATGAGLKKRLSFLKSTGNSGLTGARDNY
jgi:hypothetical protein